MKKLLMCVSVVSILFVGVGHVLAKGIFVPPGARSNGFASAFVAIADDVTAVYYNPAGLAQLENYGVEIAGLSVTDHPKGNHSLFNVAVPNQANGDFPLPKLFPSEPGEYSKKDLDISVIYPFAGFYAKSGDITYAGSVYVLTGGGGKWSDSVSDILTQTDTISASIDAMKSVSTIFNLSAGTQITKELAVGLGVDVIVISDSIYLSKDYTRGAGSLMPYDYSLNRKDTDTGSGLQLNGGVLYKFTDTLRVGAVIRSGSVINLSGTSTFRTTLAGATTVLQSGYDQLFYYPLTYGAGVAFDPIQKLTIAFAFDQSVYSVMRNKITYSAPNAGVGFVNADVGLSYSDSTQFRLGSEYRANKKLSLYAGVQTNPTPFKRDNITVLNTDQYDFTYISLGASYNFGCGIKGTLIYMNGLSEDVSRADRSYDFQQPDLVRFALDYTF